MLDEMRERPALVRFEARPVENKRESERQGKWVGKDVDFALITPPYSKDLIEMKVERFFENCKQDVKNKRIPQEWHNLWQESYKKWKAGQEIPLNGTSIKMFSALSPSQIKLLVSVDILTIEDLAACNDEGKRRIGMGAQSMIDKARAWVKDSKDHGASVMEISSLKHENDVLKGQIESLQKQVSQLMNQPVRNEYNDSYQPEDTITASDIIGDDEELGDDELVAQYTEKFGKPPHHRMTIGTIKEKLRE